MNGRGRANKVDSASKAAATGILLATVISWAAGAYWPAELLTHFRLHFVVGSAVLAAVAVARRLSAVALVATAAAAVNALPLLPYVLPGPDPGASDNPALRVLTANVRYRNTDHEGVLELVKAESPDIVGLLEVTPAWARGLAELERQYPYSVVRPEDTAHGLALFSRLPISELSTSPYREGKVQTAIRVRLVLEDRPLILTLAHLMAPMTPGQAALRNQQIREIAAMIGREQDVQHLVTGDMNISPWSPSFSLFEKSGLVNASMGKGYLATWPAILKWFGIPIDHTLLSDNLRLRSFHIGEPFGSDHLAIIADVTHAPELHSSRSTK